MQYLATVCVCMKPKLFYFQAGDYFSRLKTYAEVNKKNV